MIDWKKHFEEALAFIKEHQSLIDCHLVDFITKDLWNEYLSDSLRLELEIREPLDFNAITNNYDVKQSKTTSSELDALLQHADFLSLKNRVSVTNLADFEVRTASESERTVEADKKKYMNFTSDKKQHEIEVLARLVGRLAEKNGISLVIDAGAGKGYLSERISENYRIPVLAIDSSNTNVRGALHRRKMLLGKKKEEYVLVRYTVEHIDDKTDYKNIIRSQFGEGNTCTNCLLTGLHTCGHLTHSMIRHFLSTDHLKCLCVVPCCYHLTSETLAGNYNLSKNSRMLAQQSVERTNSKKPGDSHSPSLFYRALLQVVLQSLDIPDSRIGRGAPTRDFPSYAQWALTKIGVDREKIPSIEALAQLHRRHLSSHWKLNVFQSIRIHLGSVVEAAIVLDRVIYMQTSGHCSKVALVKLFDPLISPRCYAIVASK